ncbi:unnamed protein product, partial [Medioppia subpectinata]
MMILTNKYGIFIGGIAVPMRGIDTIERNKSSGTTAIERHKITALSAPASVFMSLLKSGTHFDISSLKKVICGGAPLPRGCTQQIVAKYPHFEDFRQAYGHLLPANCMGEICVTGPTLFKGYHNNIEATNETIDCDNFLHTGDLGYYDQNDNLFIVDRIKLLLKTDGMQVSPTELETIFLTHIAVQEVTVIGKPDEISARITPLKRIRGGIHLIDISCKEAEIYKRHGLDAICVENMFDIPYVTRRDSGPEVTAMMTRICSEVKKCVPNMAVGVQVLAGLNHEALA